MTLDEAGRIAQGLVAVPVKAQYSDDLTGGLVLKTASHDCAVGLTLSDWSLPESEFTERIIKPMASMLNAAAQECST